MDLLQNFGETQILVNSWSQSAFFLYQNRASCCRNDVSAYNHSRNASKQLFRFRFMLSQFETHGAAASRTQGRRNRAQCPQHTDSPNTRPEPSERQQKNAPHSQNPEPMHRQTENAAEDPRNRHPIRRAEDHAEPVRAEMLTGCRASRSKRPTERHTRSRSESRQLATLDRSPQNAHRTR